MSNTRKHAAKTSSHSNNWLMFSTATLGVFFFSTQLMTQEMKADTTTADSGADTVTKSTAETLPEKTAVPLKSSTSSNVTTYTGVPTADAEAQMKQVALNQAAQTGSVPAYAKMADEVAPVPAKADRLQENTSAIYTREANNQPTDLNGVQVDAYLSAKSTDTGEVTRTASARASETPGVNNDPSAEDTAHSSLLVLNHATDIQAKLDYKNTSGATQDVNTSLLLPRYILNNDNADPEKVFVPLVVDAARYKDLKIVGVDGADVSKLSLKFGGFMDDYFDLNAGSTQEVEDQLVASSSADAKGIFFVRVTGELAAGASFTLSVPMTMVKPAPGDGTYDAYQKMSDAEKAKPLYNHKNLWIEARVGTPNITNADGEEVANPNYIQRISGIQLANELDQDKLNEQLAGKYVAIHWNIRSGRNSQQEYMVLPKEVQDLMPKINPADIKFIADSQDTGNSATDPRNSPFVTNLDDTDQKMPLKPEYLDNTAYTGTLYWIDSKAVIAEMGPDNIKKLNDLGWKFLEWQTDPSKVKFNDSVYMNMADTKILMVADSPDTDSMFYIPMTKVAENKIVLRAKDTTVNVFNGDTWNADNKGAFYYGVNKAHDILTGDDVTETGEVDTTKNGVYPVTYTYTESGNATVTTTANVTVTGWADWDIATDGTLTVHKGLLKPDSNQEWQDSGKKITKVVFDGPVKVSADTTALFNNLSDAKSIDLTNVDVSKVTNFDSWFADTTALTSLKMPNFDATSGTSFQNMFANTGLTDLDLSGWKNVSRDTDKVSTKQIFADAENVWRLTLPGDLYLDYENGLPVRGGAYTYDDGNKMSIDNDWVDEATGDSMDGGMISWNYSNDAAQDDADAHPKETKTYVWKAAELDPFKVTLQTYYKDQPEGYNYYDALSKPITIIPDGAEYQITVPKVLGTGVDKATLILDSGSLRKYTSRVVETGKKIQDTYGWNYVDNGDTITFYDPRILTGGNLGSLGFVYELQPVEAKYRAMMKNAKGELVPVPGQEDGYVTVKGYQSQKYIVPEITGYKGTMVVDSKGNKLASVTSQPDAAFENHDVVDNGYALRSWKLAVSPKEAYDQGPAVQAAAANAAGFSVMDLETVESPDGSNVTVTTTDNDAYKADDKEYTVVYEPVKQKITVKFVDKDTNDVIDSLEDEAVSDQMYQFDKSKLPASTSGYEFDSQDDPMAVTPDETDTQTFMVYLKKSVAPKDDGTKTPEPGSGSSEKPGEGTKAQGEDEIPAGSQSPTPTTQSDVATQMSNATGAKVSLQPMAISQSNTKTTLPKTNESNPFALIAAGFIGLLSALGLTFRRKR